MTYKLLSEERCIIVIQQKLIQSIQTYCRTTTFQHHECLDSMRIGSIYLRDVNLVFDKALKILYIPKDALY